MWFLTQYVVLFSYAHVINIIKLMKLYVWLWGALSQSFSCNNTCLRASDHHGQALKKKKKSFLRSVQQQSSLISCSPGSLTRTEEFCPWYLKQTPVLPIKNTEACFLPFIKSDFEPGKWVTFWSLCSMTFWGLINKFQEALFMSFSSTLKSNVGCSVLWSFRNSALISSWSLFFPAHILGTDRQETSGRSKRKILKREQASPRVSEGWCRGTDELSQHDTCPLGNHSEIFPVHCMSLLKAKSRQSLSLYKSFPPFHY